MKDEERAREEECEELWAKCEAVMTEFEKNPTVAEKARLEAIEVSLQKEVEELKQDMRVVAIGINHFCVQMAPRGVRNYQDPLFHHKNQYGKAFLVHLREDIPRSSKQIGSQILLDLRKDLKDMGSDIRAYLVLHTWVAGSPYGEITNLSLERETWGLSINNTHRGLGVRIRMSRYKSIRYMYTTRGQGGLQRLAIFGSSKVGCQKWGSFISRLPFSSTLASKGPTDGATDCENIGTIRLQ
uniref:Uncharacterized protein n=1 Tax=Tanacetum cinerariifolium TaxID=118510 RepID=A0A699IYP9_TANCI|nr:hypothetical protein [Tanacetum cinerariifolium]